MAMGAAPDRSLRSSASTTL